MEHLGHSLSQIASLPSASSAESVDVERLQYLDETRLLQLDRDRVADTLAQLPADASSTRGKAERMLAALDAKLALGIRRDAIQATRPTGCWCLGLGGRGARYIPSLEDDGDAVRVWDQYCPCPEGAAAEVRDNVERADYRAHQAQHRVRQYFHQAQVPPRFEQCSFDTYPVSPETAAAVAVVREWAQCADLADSLLLYGLYGTGKTGLAVAAMRAWITNAHDAALFITVPDLLDRIRATYGSPKRQRDDGEPTEQDLLDSVREVGLLVLDDLGAERPTDWVQEKLFAIINARHDQQQATIFTSNLDPAALAAHLGERTAWRIVEMCEVIHLEGPNLRDRSK